MICVRQNIDDSLSVVNLSPSQECQFIELVQQHQLDSPESVLSYELVIALFLAAAGLYALSFVFRMILTQLGFRG